MKGLRLLLTLILCVMMSHFSTVLSSAEVEEEVLEDIFSIQELEDDTVKLTQLAIEIKANKDMSGVMAVIYDKEYKEAAITERMADYYKVDKEKMNKDLIKACKGLLAKFEKKIELIDIEMPKVLQTLQMLRDYIEVLETNPLSTLDMEIQQISQLLIEFDTSFQAEFDLNNAKFRDKFVAALRIRNIDLQSILDGLNEQLNKYALKAEEDINKLISKQLIQTYEDKLGNNSSVHITEVDYNEKEIFIKLKFNKLSDLHSGFVIGPMSQRDGLENNQTLETIIDTYTQVHMEPQAINFTRELIEDLRIRTEQINTIVLERNGIGLVQNFSKQLQATLEDYNGTQDIEALLKVELLDFKDHLITYQNEKGKIKDDTEGTTKVIDLIENWFSRIDHQKSEEELNRQVLDSLEGYHFLSLHTSNPIPVGIRISIEGKFVVNTLPNGQIDTENNYFLNMSSSGERAMRLLDSETDFIAVFEPDFIGFSKVKVAFIIYLMVLILLFIFRREWFKNVLTMNILLLLAAIVIYPLVWVVGASFNTSSSLGAVGINPFPKDFSLIQYERLFLTTDYGKWFLNSFKIAIANMLITVTFAVSAAYAFSRFKFKGKKVGLMSMLIIQIFPSFSAMVAIYTLLANVKFLEFLTGEASLVNTHLGLILVYCAGQIPYNTWLIKGYFDTLPRSMDEAAKIDGANNIQAFIRIILPLGRPIIAFVAVTSFMAPWMDFILPRLLLKSTDKKTLAVGLFEMINGNSNNQFTMFAAGAVLVAVPITLMYAYFQKYIVKGLASGAVKG